MRRKSARAPVRPRVSMQKKDDTPVSIFLKKLFVSLDNAGFAPIADSPAAQEIQSFSRPEKYGYLLTKKKAEK